MLGWECWAHRNWCRSQPGAQERGNSVPVPRWDPKRAPFSLRATPGATAEQFQPCTRGFPSHTNSATSSSSHRPPPKPSLHFPGQPVALTLLCPNPAPSKSEAGILFFHNLVSEQEQVIHEIPTRMMSHWAKKAGKGKILGKWSYYFISNGASAQLRDKCKTPGFQFGFHNIWSLKGC